MKATLFLVSMSFGLGMGQTEIHTAESFTLLAGIIATGATLEHVTIKPVSNDGTTTTGTTATTEAGGLQPESWQFLEWS